MCFIFALFNTGETYTLVEVIPAVDISSLKIPGAGRYIKFSKATVPDCPYTFHAFPWIHSSAGTATCLV